MNWTDKEMHRQCRRLEPIPKNFDNLALVVLHRELSVWSFGRGGDELFSCADVIVDTLMSSSQFDRDLFIMLTSMLDVDVTTALEICLS
jgi:hypothetical protein